MSNIESFNEDMDKYVYLHFLRSVKLLKYSYFFMLLNKFVFNDIFSYYFHLI